MFQYLVTAKKEITSQLRSLICLESITVVNSQLGNMCCSFVLCVEMSLNKISDDYDTY